MVGGGDERDQGDDGDNGVRISPWVISAACAKKKLEKRAGCGVNGLSPRPINTDKTSSVK